MPKSLGSKFNRDDAAMARGENGMSSVLIDNYVADVEANEREIDKIMDEAREKCEPFKEHIAEVKKAAAENGIPKKPFEAKLKERKHLRKANSVTDTLTDEQKDAFYEITAKLKVPLQPEEQAAE